MTRPIGFGPAAPDLLLHRLSGRCPPMTFLREFTVNAIDAGATEVAWVMITINGIRKLGVLDNGAGFDPAAMEQLLGDLYQSSHASGNGKHHGIGAKISSITANPEGVEYFSKRDGVCYRAMLTPHGLQDQRVRPDEAPLYVAEVGPQRIKAPKLREWDSGTLVIFHGAAPEDHTYDCPGVPGGRSWVPYALNERFATFPQGVKVTWQERRDTAGTKFDQIHVTGLAPAFDTHATVSRGTIDVPVGSDLWSVAWRILPEKKGGSKSREPLEASIAAVYHDQAVRAFDELYEHQTRASSRMRMGQFGLHHASSRVTLWVTPPPDFVPDDPRLRLERGTEQIPWVAIGQGFAKRAPAELRDLEAASSANRVSDISDSWKRKLECRLEAFSVDRWRYDPRGRETATINQLGTPDRKPGDTTGTNPDTDITRARDTQVKRTGTKKGPTRAHPTKPALLMPDVEFVPADQLDEPRFIAQYLEDGYLVLINEDHKAIDELVQAALTQVIARPDLREQVREIVRSELKLLAAQHVINATYAVSSNNLTSTEAESVLTPAGFFPTLTERVHIEVAINAEIKTLTGLRLKAA